MLRKPSSASMSCIATLCAVGTHKCAFKLVSQYAGVCHVNRLLQPPLVDDAVSDLCEMGSPDPLAAAASRSAWPPDAVPFSSVHVNALFGEADSPGGKRSGVDSPGGPPGPVHPGSGEEVTQRSSEGSAVTPPRQRARGGGRMSAGRSLFSSPTAGLLQSPPSTGVRDIAGRWHTGGSPLQWAA